MLKFLSTIIFPSMCFSRLVRKSLLNFADPIFGDYMLNRINTSWYIDPLINKYCPSWSVVSAPGGQVPRGYFISSVPSMSCRNLHIMHIIHHSIKFFSIVLKKFYKNIWVLEKQSSRILGYFLAILVAVLGQMVQCLAERYMGLSSARNQTQG